MSELNRMKDIIENFKVYLNKEFNKKKYQKKIKDQLNKEVLLKLELNRSLELQEFLLRKINRIYSLWGYESDEFFDKEVSEVIIYLSVEVNKVCIKVWRIKGELLKLGQYKIRNFKYYGEKE